MTERIQLDQFLPSLTYGDAIANHVLALRSVLANTYASRIFYQHCDERMESEGARFWEYSVHRSGRGVALHHLSIGSDIGQFLVGRDEPILVDYHDMTPPEFFAPYDGERAELLERGQWELELLADRCRFAWAHSEYARKDLEKAGYPHTTVLPILVDFSKLEGAPDRRTLSWLAETRGDGPDILFVGRVAPNKCHHDLVKLVRVYTELCARRPRLLCVGPHSGPRDPYYRAVRELARELGIESQVVLAGAVSLSQLRAYYRAADVYVTMSEHEGFCVPLLEAMHAGLPVVAYGAAAVPETVAQGAVVLQRKDLVEFAIAVERLANDPVAREAVAAAGRERLRSFDAGRVATCMLEAIASVV